MKTEIPTYVINLLALTTILLILLLLIIQISIYYDATYTDKIASLL